MDEKREGAIQVVAAARAGFSERTGRRIEADPVWSGVVGSLRAKSAAADLGSL